MDKRLSSRERIGLTLFAALSLVLTVGLWLAGKYNPGMPERVEVRVISDPEETCDSANMRSGVRKKRKSNSESKKTGKANPRRKRYNKEDSRSTRDFLAEPIPLETGSKEE